MRHASLALAALLALAACRTDEPAQVPPATTIPTYEQAARTAPDVAETYRLIGINDRKVPTRAAMVEGCAVHLDSGTLTLGLDARYRLDFTTRQVCNGQTGYAVPAATPDPAHPAPEAIQKEGLYTVVGKRVLFGNKIRLTIPEDAPEQRIGPDALHEALFLRGRLDANGAIRDTVLTLTLDDMRTYVFARERGAPPPETTPRPRDLNAPTAPPDRPAPTEGEAAREGVFPSPVN